MNTEIPEKAHERMTSVSRYFQLPSKDFYESGFISGFNDPAHGEMLEIAVKALEAIVQLPEKTKGYHCTALDVANGALIKLRARNK